MKKLTFKGGIHPNDNKMATSGKAIKVLQPAEIMVFPMLQHLGAPCVPTVKKGDYVKMWQKIGEAEAFMCSPVHSSVSGEVIAIEPRLVPNGSMVNSVVIKNDFKDDIFEGVAPAGKDKSIIDIVKEAGIVGMGGAGFPTHIKLSPPKDKKITTIIVNGAECEPYLTSDHRVMLETPKEVVFGLRAIMEGLKISDGRIAIESNKPDAIDIIKNIASKEKNIAVVALNTKYPQGSEKQLIEVVTGKQVPSGGLPLDVGVIVVNIDTCTAVARAINKGMPLVRRIVTVTGPIIKEPQNFAVRLGMPIKDIIEAAGGTTEEIKKLIMGGPLMGIALSTPDVPVVKVTSAILAFGENDLKMGREQNCIRCGKCIEVCPIKIYPNYLCDYAESRDLEKCQKHNIIDCMECGCCTFVCPSRRHIVQAIRNAKGLIRESNKK